METLIDEAIERYKNNAEYERTHGNLQSCLDFRQLAEWLTELKKLRADRDRLQDTLDKILAEIQDGLNACVDIIDNTKRGVYPQIYSNDQMEGRKMTYEHCLEITSKHIKEYTE